jgi:hypothetical protein
MNKVILVAIAAAAALVASPGFAQQPAPGAAIWAEAGCSSCHGGIGQGGGGGENPAGPNLWRARINAVQFKDVVACGREKTGMPYHLAGAFKQHACWGRPPGEPPVEAVGGGELSQQQIDSLTGFFMENVVGKEPVTKAKCGLFFANGGANPMCSRYP